MKVVNTKALQEGAKVDFSPGVIEIDLDAIAANLKTLRNRIGKGTDVMAIVKANSYGLGAIPIAKRLESLGVSLFGVAHLSEAIALREGGVKNPIVILTGAQPHEFAIVLKLECQPVFYSLPKLEAFNEWLEGKKISYPVHLKFDTGMTRLGFHYEELADVVPAFKRLKNLKWEGLMSHLAESEKKNSSFTPLQCRRMEKIKAYLHEQRMEFRYYHLANSAGAWYHPQARHNLVRSGLFLYGALSGESVADMNSVVTMKGKVLSLKWVPSGSSISYGRLYRTKRKTCIATVSLGYADGVPRLLKNGDVLIHGQRVPILGAVCMDMLMADVTDLLQVNNCSVDVGDEVAILGRQGKSCIRLEELASRSGLSPYEILCHLSPRFERRYFSQGRCLSS